MEGIKHANKITTRNTEQIYYTLQIIQKTAEHK